MVMTSYNWDYTITTPPAVEPVSVSEVKEQLNLSSSLDDALIGRMITAARIFGESITKRTFISTGFRTFRNNFSDYQNEGEFYANFSVKDYYYDMPPITLRRSPYLTGAAITYTKSDNTTGTLVLDTDFYVEKKNEFSRLRPETCWPTDAKNRSQAITIDFTAGYGPNASDVPADIRHAIIENVVDYYNNRGDCADCSGCASSNVMRIYRTYKILGV